jgi:tetratricopeptide (TPR) repeat protein
MGALFIGASVLSSVLPTMTTVIPMLDVAASTLAPVAVGVAAISGNLWASVLDRWGQRRSEWNSVLENEDLTKAVGKAMAAIFALAAKDEQYREHRQRLIKIANTAEASWLEIASVELSQSDYSGLTEDQLTGILASAEQGSNQQIILAEKAWVRLVEDLDVYAKQNREDRLSGSVVRKLAAFLQQEFPKALRQIFKDDFACDGKAFAGLILESIREIRLDLSEDQAQLSAQLDTLLKRLEGDDKQKLEFYHQISEQVDSGFAELCQRFGVFETSITGLLDGIREELSSIKEDTAKTVDNTEELLKGQKAIFGAIRASEQTEPILWNVPHTRNPHFTGRSEELQKLREQLVASGTAGLSQVQAISGLGGIGKTQTALEYAHRHRKDYSAAFWVQADTDGQIRSGFINIARNLNLQQKDEADQNIIVNAAKCWLDTHPDWLLIFDNADEPKIVQDYLPQQSNGHILVTSRAQDFSSLGINEPVFLNKLKPGEAVRFLLESTGRSLYHPEKPDAEKLAKELDYLPLALEQASAYITNLKCSFTAYLARYAKQKIDWLEKGKARTKYPTSVAKTWALNFEKVQEESPASAALLQISAFLSPDNIPFELITLGREELGTEISEFLSGEIDEITIAELFNPLTSYSLVQVDHELKTYSIHRLVQEVLKAKMDEEGKKECAGKVVRALNRSFPASDYDNWQQCERQITQVEFAETELTLIWSLEIEEAGHLFNKAGYYLHQRGQYFRPEKLFMRSLMTREKVLDSEHPDVTNSLNNLAALYRSQGKYEQAEALYTRSLNIREKVLGSEHPDVATSLNNLAVLYESQGKYEEAEPLFTRSLNIREKVLGSEHPDVAESLNNLAVLYESQGKYKEAEPLFIRSLVILKKVLDSEHPDVATSLNNLALLYESQGKCEEAEHLYTRSLVILEKVLGSEHPNVAASLNNLAGLYRSQGKYEEAEPLYTRSLNIREKVLGSEHPDVATSLNNLASLYESQGKYEQAEHLYTRSLKILEKVLGSEHPNVANSFNNLAGLYESQGKYKEAEHLYTRSLIILMQALGQEHPNTLTVWQNYITFLQKIVREHPETLNYLLANGTPITKQILEQMQNSAS